MLVFLSVIMGVVSMSVRLVHVSDIHFGSGESHGRINPDTGLNTRFEDFVRALAKVVDYCLDNSVDVFLFSGDAYRNASPEPVYQKMFARELHRLSKADVKTILVVGNHDQILRSTDSHAMSVFQSLEVPGLIIVDKPCLERIETKNGEFQLIGLPHVTRHNLMTLEKYCDLGAVKIDEILVKHVGDLLQGYYAELDASKPTVVTAHMSLDRAVAGIEEELLVGYTLTFPCEIFIDEKIDYVAMGHIHKHQIIREQDPAVVYAGSLERVDFGEEKEDKGFVDVSLARGATSYRFVSIEPRPFITVDIDLVGKTGSENDSVLTGMIIDKVRKHKIPGCVMRVRYRVEQARIEDVNERLVRAAAADCLSLRLIPEIVQDRNRARLPQLTESSVSSPVKALETYLDEVAPESKERLIKRALDVMSGLSDEFHKSEN